MTTSRISVSRLSLATIVVYVLVPFGAIPFGTIMAAPCEGVPSCEQQTMQSVSYGAWDTKGWAYYCTGDHPYYWNNGPDLGFGNNFSFDNHCFTVTENPFAENEPSKMDATITNWCLKHETITVTLGCSQQPQTIACPNNNPGPPISDPGCPVVSGTQKTYCNSGPIPVCIQTWEENCSSGPVFCTKDTVLPTWCIPCG